MRDGSDHERCLRSGIRRKKHILNSTIKSGLTTPFVVVLAFGTRPEATKMAPVYRALQGLPGIRPLILLTGQHREQLEHAIELFGIQADADLKVMTSRQRLPELAARILPQAAATLTEMKADYVLVHGDTLSTFVVAWAAFLEQIPVGHVEAGLRTHNVAEPFPEEMNRRLTDAITDLDLAPTPLAKQNLLREGKAEARIVVTGQTGIDAILYAARVGQLPSTLPPGPYVTITLHRRENWPLLAGMCATLARIATEHPRLSFVYPVHLNPTVREAVYPILSPIPNFVLIEPLEYGAMAGLLSRSALIVTDSGGLQEEGAALGVPVVVLRNVTERPEGLITGILTLAGTDPDNIYRIVCRLLDQPRSVREAGRVLNPYGDGHAGERVARAVAWRLGCGERPEDWHDGARD